MSQEVEYQTERLDHLGIVAGVCQEAGIAEWLDKQAGENRRSVSVGKATVAMVLNGLGFSNRQLYLVPQYFENKPVEHLLGEGITADMRERSTVWGAPWIGSTSMMSPRCLPDWRCKPVAASALPHTICMSIRPHSRSVETMPPKTRGTLCR